LEGEEPFVQTWEPSMRRAKRRAGTFEALRLDVEGLDEIGVSDDRMVHDGFNASAASSMGDGASLADFSGAYSPAQIIIQKSFFAKAPWIQFWLDEIEEVHREDLFVSNDKEDEWDTITMSAGGQKTTTTTTTTTTPASVASKKTNQYGLIFSIGRKGFVHNNEYRTHDTTGHQHMNPRLSPSHEKVSVFFDSLRRRDEWFNVLLKLRIETIGQILSEESRKLVQLYNQIPTMEWVKEPTPTRQSQQMPNKAHREDVSASNVVVPGKAAADTPRISSSRNRSSTKLKNIQNTLKQQCIKLLQDVLVDAHSSILTEQDQEDFLSAIPHAFQKTLYHDSSQHTRSDEGSDTSDTHLPYIAERANHWKIDFSALKIDQKLAEGAFGTVFKGSYYEKEVAIKKLKLRDNVLSTELIEDLRKEAEILASIRHPHIILFLGITDPPEMCLVTEFMEQGSIYQVLRKNILNDLQVHSILMDICYGILFIHKQKILHLDLKPANILMSKNGFIAKVADFGISRVLGESEKIVDDTQEGTLLYMSPELAFQRVMSSACDVFSFGVVLYEILYLKEHPSALMNYDGFEDERIVEMAFDLIRETGDHDEAPPHCPAWWNDSYAQLCRDCLKQVPEDRITFPEILARLKTIRDLHQEDPWFIFEETSHKIHEVTKDLELIKALNPNFKVTEVIQYCLSEYRTPTIHYYSLCSLIHMSCIHVDSQMQFLQKSIVHLFEISSHSKTFFEKKGNFIYWNLLLDSKCLSITDKERVLKHALDLCKNSRILRRFMRQGALGCLTYKLDRMRNTPNTPLPFFSDSEFPGSVYFHGDYFAPALYPDAAKLLCMICKDTSLTEAQVVEENVIPALVSLSSRGIHDTIAVNGLVYQALEALADLLTRFPSLSDLCYNLHVNPKLLASREYLGAIMKFEQVINKDRKALNQVLTVSSPQHHQRAHSSSLNQSNRSGSNKRLSLQNSTSPLPKSTLTALRSHLERQKSKRLSLTNLKEKVEVQSQLSKLLEEKNESLQLLDTHDHSRNIDQRERESIVIKFWESIKSELETSNISTEVMERSLIHHYKKANLEKQQNGIRFIKGLVQQIDEPSRVVDQFLYLGSEWNAASKEELLNAGIKVIVNVSANAPCYFPNDFQYYRIRESEHMHSSFVEVCQILEDCMQKDTKVLLHSTLGTNRAPSYCIAFLMKDKRWDLKRAYKLVQERREISVQRRFIKQLMMWGSFLAKSGGDSSPERHGDSEV